MVRHGVGLDGVDLELGWSWVSGPEGARLSLRANVRDGTEMSVTSLVEKPGTQRRKVARYPVAPSDPLRCGP